MRKFLSGLAAAMLMINIGYAADAAVKAPVAASFECAPLKARSLEQNIILGSDAATASAEVYLLKNTSNKSLWLDHPVKKPSASAGWSSYLRPGNGSAILLNKKDFALSCSVISPGKVISVKCGEALSLCVAKKVSINSNRKGSYWLVEDKSWAELLKLVAKKSAN